MQCLVVFAFPHTYSKLERGGCWDSNLKGGGLLGEQNYEIDSLISSLHHVKFSLSEKAAWPMALEEFHSLQSETTRDQLTGLPQLAIG